MNTLKGVLFEAKFRLYEIVNIDNDVSICAAVTAVQFRSYREPLYELSWIANGEAKACWVEEPRLLRAEP